MRKKVILLVSIFVLLSGCVQEERHSLIFKGSELHFRSDLNKAVNVPVFPDEALISRLIFNDKLEKITIAIPNVSKAGYYGVAGYELAYKLTFLYNSIYSSFSKPEVFEENNYTCLYYKDFEKTICIGKTVFSDYESLKGGKNEIVIALLGEGLANETEIVIEQGKNLILVKGKSFSQKNRKYTDLDLAVDKFLLILFDYLGNRRV